jgi:hypothetical protein
MTNNSANRAKLLVIFLLVTKGFQDAYDKGINNKMLRQGMTGHNQEWKIVSQEVTMIIGSTPARVGPAELRMDRIRLSPQWA